MKDRTLRHYQEMPFKQDVIKNKTFQETLTFYALEKYDFEKKQICDIGCSTSFIGNFIKLNYSQYKYLGIDFNFRAVKIAHSKKIKVVVGDNMSIPLSDECSDFTISQGVIHHIPDPNPSRYFKELIRITRKGGFISLLVYKKNSYYSYLYKACGLLRLIYQSHTKLSRWIIFKIFFNIYYPIFFIIVTKMLGIKEKVPLREALSNFHDQILNPVVYFFREVEIKSLADNNGLILLRFKKKLMGKSLLFLFRKA